MSNLTLKEFLLSQGINSKQERYERKIRINDNLFNIKVDDKLKSEILELSIKEVFLLVYKSLLFVKNTHTFSILYLPKNIVLKGKCTKLSNNKFEIILFDELEYNKENLDEEKNIAIIDKIDSDIEIEVL